jgi:hypothetical protein
MAFSVVLVLPVVVLELVVVASLLPRAWLQLLRQALVPEFWLLAVVVLLLVPSSSLVMVFLLVSPHPLVLVPSSCK